MSEGKTYTLDDPRPLAADHPYTYFLPSPAELDALEPGDLVKLIFRPREPGRKWDAERMWVRVEEIGAEGVRGRLENEPEDVPGLHHGDEIRFQRWHAIDRIWSKERRRPPPQPARRLEYWERCLVDACVLDDGASVHFLYREEPDPPDGDEPADSGWRIRGDYRNASDAEVDAREAEYVALGAVLNVDDSWIGLVDAPVGSRFIRDWESGEFVREDGEEASQ